MKKVIVCLNSLMNGSEKLLKRLNIVEIPYNVVALNILDTVYKDYEILLVGKDQFYLNKAQQELEGEMNRIVYTSEKPFDQLAKDNEILCGFNYKALKNANSYSFKGNILEYILFLIFFNKKSKVNRCIFANGILMEFIKKLNLWIPIFSIWPVLFEDNIISESFTIKYFICNIFFNTSIGILRSIVEINEETRQLKNGFNPLISKEFILGSTSILGSLSLAILLNLLGLMIGASCIKAIAFSLSCTAVNYITMLYPKILRVCVIFLWLIIGLLLFDLHFARIFLYKIFV